MCAINRKWEAFEWENINIFKFAIDEIMGVMRISQICIKNGWMEIINYIEWLNIREHVKSFNELHLINAHFMYSLATKCDAL